MERDEFYEAALAFAKSKGWERDELPRGDRASAHTCPLALACGQPTWSEFWFSAPIDVRTFVLRFDMGHYPDLIGDDDWEA